MKNELGKLILLLFLFALTPAVVFSQKIKHVILIGSDGFGAYAFENAKVPYLRTMMKEGSWSLQARTVLPSSSASKYIIEKKPNFLFVHLHDVDSVGHNVGHGTPEYYAAVERTDTHIGTILKSIKEAGIEKNTVVLFTADHGGVNKGHGLISMNEMQIPWIMRGPGIQRNRELTESIMTFDTAATIAKLLKLKVPQAWIGRPVKGAFNK